MGTVWLIVFITFSASLANAAPAEHGKIIGVVTDSGGQVFNVKAYGAKGNGTADDTPAFDAAYRAAMTAGGGRIYFPAGSYVLKSPHPIDSQSATRNVSIGCSGPTSTTLLIEGAGFVLHTIHSSPFFQGFVRDCAFNMTGAPAGAAAVTILDTTSWTIEGSVFYDSKTTNRHIGIEMEDREQWCERNQIIDDSFTNLWTGIAFVYTAGDHYNSFGYNFLIGDEFQVPDGGIGVLANGAGVVYSSSWIIRGNFAGPKGTLVYAKAGMAMRFNQFDIRGEGGGSTNLLCADAKSNITFTGEAYAFGTASDQTFACPGTGNVISYARAAGVSNLVMPSSRWPGAFGPLHQYVDRVAVDGGSGTGHVIGSNISAPYVWMYADHPGNEFTIFTAHYPPSPANLDPVSWFDWQGNGVFTGHVQVAGGGGPTWSAGSGAPAGACKNGSLYSNTSGAAGSTFYVCVSGAWKDVK